MNPDAGGRRAAEPSETRSARDVHRREAAPAEEAADLEAGDTATPFRHPNRPERKKAGGNFNGPQKG